MAEGLLMKMLMNRKQGILAISPMVVLMVFIILFTIHSVGQTGDKSSDTNLSLTVAFLFASVYAIITSRGFSLKQRIEAYSRGAGASNLMLMLWIYVLAGAFAASAKQMGSIDATVSLTLAFLPASMILPGLFVAAGRTCPANRERNPTLHSGHSRWSLFWRQPLVHLRHDGCGHTDSTMQDERQVPSQRDDCGSRRAGHPRCLRLYGRRNGDSDTE